MIYMVICKGTLRMILRKKYETTFIYLFITTLHLELQNFLIQVV